MTDITCGHEHDDPVDALACFTARWLKRQLGDGVAVTVIISPPRPGGILDPSISSYANMNGAAAMMLAFCQGMAAQPRPTDCPDCQAAHDRMTAAALILAPGHPQGSC